MDENKVIQLVFKNEDGKKVTLSLDDPKDALTETEIKTAMETVVTKNVFKKNNYSLVSAVSAKIVKTSTTTYDLVL